MRGTVPKVLTSPKTLEMNRRFPPRSPFDATSRLTRNGSKSQSSATMEALLGLSPASFRRVVQFSSYMFLGGRKAGI